MNDSEAALRQAVSGPLQGDQPLSHASSMTREFGKPPPLSAFCEKLVDQSRFDKKNTAPPSVAGSLGTLGIPDRGLGPHLQKSKDGQTNETH